MNLINFRKSLLLGLIIGLVGINAGTSDVHAWGLPGFGVSPAPFNPGYVSAPVNLIGNPYGFSGLGAASSTGAVLGSGSSQNLARVLNMASYPAPTPSYPGWYGPYGHVGFPCPTCHDYP